MPAQEAVKKTVEQQLLDYLKETPKAVAVLVMSYFSGHLWVFIITAFLRSKTRGNKQLQSVTGKTTVGLLWFTAVMLLVYLLKHGEYNFGYSRILDVTIPTLVTGLLLQLIAFALFVIFGDRR